MTWGSKAFAQKCLDPALFDCLVQLVYQSRQLTRWTRPWPRLGGKPCFYWPVGLWFAPRSELKRIKEATKSLNQGWASMGRSTKAPFTHAVPGCICNQIIKPGMSLNGSKHKGPFHTCSTRMHLNRRLSWPVGLRFGPRRESKRINEATKSLNQGWTSMDRSTKASLTHTVPGCIWIVFSWL